MSAKCILKISNLQFSTDLIELPVGGEIEIKVLNHTETALYSGSQRKFIIHCNEFDTPELYPGNSFIWKFTKPGKYLLQCPLYSWMKANVIISSYENPQDPNMFLHKLQVKVQTRNASAQSYVKKKLEPPSIGSSVGSEDEVKDLSITQDEGIDKEIEKLFLSVQAECERDQIKPANLLKQIEEDLAYETREKVTRNKDVINVEREEKKGKVVFVTRTMAPSRYFPEYQQKKSNKSINKIKKREKVLRKRLKSNKEFCKKVLNSICLMKVNSMHTKMWLSKSSKNPQKDLIIERKKKDLEKEKSDLDIEFQKLKINLTTGQQEKMQEFMNEEGYNEKNLFEEHIQRQIASQIFGLSKLWWAEDIFNPPSQDPLPNFYSSLSVKNVEKFLMDRNKYIGWENN
ncbi:hypothetical protein SteCoe_1006 [Stentor coeruleus]|uniref:Uncharacterized protein n=1 Tax=Stentor coeruleus TaxID=5963 RepID=A0A1R2D300_9CILI|nr:hypothetical protein SteCoe_1006 [Stentor coeruleus]